MNWHERLKKKFAQRNSEAFIAYLRRQGCAIGNDCTIYEPAATTIDLTRPYLISIGSRVRITKGVSILSHGFEWSVLREIYQRPYGNCGPVNIGNNVFIGMHTLVLKNVDIGDNVIIGAGSVVSKSIKADSVAAGNPARVLCSIDEYHQKMACRQDHEAKQQARFLWERWGRLPKEEDFHKSYFHLFMDFDEIKKHSIPASQLGSGAFCNTQKRYASFDEFLSACKVIQKGQA